MLTVERKHNQHSCKTDSKAGISVLSLSFPKCHWDCDIVIFSLRVGVIVQLDHLSRRIDRDFTDTATWTRGLVSMYRCRQDNRYEKDPYFEDVSPG